MRLIYNHNRTKAPGERGKERSIDNCLSVSDPTSTQWPLYQGLTCPPPSLLNTATTCSLGGYASYSLNASSVAHIQQAVNFARNSNLRLVIKNTGHDFADKSLGAGALSIWTHHLKDLQFLEKYEYGEYKGSALKLGAGVETEDVYKMAEEKEVTVAGGECRTVGIAGGYVAGGGHSMMSSLVGMAADQVCWESLVDGVMSLDGADRRIGSFNGDRTPGRAVCYGESERE